MSVCLCVHGFSTVLFVFSVQSTRRSSQWQDRGRSALTYRTTHLRKNSPLSTAPFSLSAFLLLLFFSLSFSLTPLSLTQTEIPLSYCTQFSLSPFFFGFRSLTLSVSFYIMLSVKIPCGRAVSNKHNRTHWLHMLTLTLTCMRVRIHRHTHTYAWTHICITCNTTFHCSFHRDQWRE